MQNAYQTVAALRSDSAAEKDRAWRDLYDQHFPWVYRLVVRFGVPAHDAEDVTQQVFLIAYRRLLEIDKVDSIGGWLRGIVVRVVSGHHRWHKVRRVKRWLVESTWRQGAGAPATPERQTESARTQERIGEVLAGMSPKLRSVLVLADIEECSVSEVAGILEIPVNTVRSRRRLAREAFRRMWRQQSEGQP